MSDLNPCMWNRTQRAALMLTVLLCMLLGAVVGMAAGEMFEPPVSVQNSDGEHIPGLRPTISSRGVSSG